MSRAGRQTRLQGKISARLAIVTHRSQSKLETELKIKCIFMAHRFIAKAKQE